MPPFMSSQTRTAVSAEPKPAHSTRTPGSTYVTYAVPVWMAPPDKADPWDENFGFGLDRVLDGVDVLVREIASKD